MALRRELQTRRMIAVLAIQYTKSCQPRARGLHCISPHHRRYGVEIYGDKKTH